MRGIIGPIQIQIRVINGSQKSGITAKHKTPMRLRLIVAADLTDISLTSTTDRTRPRGTTGGEE